MALQKLIVHYTARVSHFTLLRLLFFKPMGTKIDYQWILANAKWSISRLKARLGHLSPSQQALKDEFYALRFKIALEVILKKNI